MDEADRGIMHYLRENARTTFVDISKALGTFDATVYNRVKRLMELGAIAGFTMEVDETAIDKRTHGFILVNVKHTKRDRRLHPCIASDWHGFHGFLEQFPNYRSSSLLSENIRGYKV